MRLLLLGATGATGGLVLERALDAGHDVVALVRSRSSLASRPGLTVHEGDVRDAAALAAASTGVDAVISTLGIGKAKSPDGFIETVSRALVEASRTSGVRRLVMMSAFGVGNSLAKASLPLRLMYRGGAVTFADKAAGEQLLRASDLDWTLAYPVLLTKGPETSTTRVLDLDAVDRLGGVPRVSRADVARVLLELATSGASSRTTVVLTSGGRS